ncbi:MAG TPA: hypothetical protein ENI15_00545 [Spirochaetes bacterium]|nr:hypothetical protein [Spirochaetota bacterium]
MGHLKRCLRCDRLYSERPSISRRDNRAMICPGCGVAEALFDITVFFIQREGKEREKRALKFLIEAERAWVNFIYVGS